MENAFGRELFFFFFKDTVDLGDDSAEANNSGSESVWGGAVGVGGHVNRRCGRGGGARQRRRKKKKNK